MLKSLFHQKNVSTILNEANQSTHDKGLRRTLGPWNITMLGIGAIIGAGIFATIGTAAAGDALRLGAGPSLIVSFAITAVVCAFTALCYAEFAAMVPVSGSAYTYAYSTLGELVAWIIGWDLIIEYAIGNVAVAISWSNYYRSLLESIGIKFPFWLAIDYRTAARTEGLLDQAPHIFGMPIVFNMLAFGIVMLITLVLVWGIRESARFNAIMVFFKLAVLAFFVGGAFYFVSPSEMQINWQPFQPNGWTGTMSAAAVLFFAYIGFDAVSTVAEETKNPTRDIPFGIIASLIICTIIYAGVAAVFTGVIPYEKLLTLTPSEKAEPLTYAIGYMAPDATWAKAFLAIGSVVAQTAVLLVFQLGQPRIFFAMARDGLLPKAFSKIHPVYRTPHVTTIFTGLVVGIFAGIANLDEMVDLTNIGTLFAFILVCIGIPILRIQDPTRNRPFRVPFGPWVIPVLGVFSCIGLIVYLPPSSWWRFAAWLAFGLAVYCQYGFSNSVIAKKDGRQNISKTALRTTALGFLTMGIGMLFHPHDTKLTVMVVGGIRVLMGLVTANRKK